MLKFRHPLIRLPQFYCNIDEPPADPPGGGTQPPAPPAAPPAAPPIPARPAGQTDAERVAALENTIANTRAEAAANRVEARTARESEQSARAEITRIQAEATQREQAARDAGNTELVATLIAWSTPN